MRTLQNFLYWCSSRVFFLFIIITVYWGITVRDYGYYTAESGLGYWMGITGGSFMLLLLLYSFSKRIQSFQRLFSLKRWFQIHMVLGILGPLLIMFHSNFGLGSLNSNVALVSMLLVAGSGLIGRYLYLRIYNSLSGSKIRLEQCRTEIRQLLSALPPSHERQETVKLVQILSEEQTQASTFSAAFSGRKRTQNIIRMIQYRLRIIETNCQRQKTDDRAAVDKLIRSTKRIARTVKKVAGLHLFEKLFSLWHVIHIPIFFLMIITAVTHVVVVHMY